MLSNFTCAAMFRKLPLEIFFIKLQRCKATVILPFLTIIRELSISIFCIILQWYTAKVISPFLVNWSVKTTPLSSFLARAGALFSKSLKAIAIYAKTSLVTFLCFLIVFNYFPFTVFNILASFIYGFNASTLLCKPSHKMGFRSSVSQCKVVIRGRENTTVWFVETMFSQMVS